MTDSIENIDSGNIEDNEDKHMLRQVGMMMEQVSGPSWLAISDKITPKHISTVLEQVGISQQNSDKQSLLARIERFAYVAIVTGMLIFFTIYLFPRDQDMYVQILEWAGILLTGGIGGYGLGIRKSKRSE